MKRILLTFTFLFTTLSYQAQTVSTLAGNIDGITGSDDGIGTAASFYQPYGVALDNSGNIYVVDSINNKIRKITPTGEVSTFAGTGAIGSANGAAATATFKYPRGIAIDSDGTIYVADYGNHKIRKITQSGIVSTFAGSGAAGNIDATGTAASFNNPTGISIDSDGNIYVADTTNNKIRKISPTGVVTTLAGSGYAGDTDGIGENADFQLPYGVVADNSGNVYVTDYGNNKIKKITASGLVTTIAGNGSYGSDDGIGAAASFYLPGGITMDNTRSTIYIGANINNKIRKVTLAGEVTTVAGTGLAGMDDGDVAIATFNNPQGLALDASGNIYIADRGNSKIRKISGFITPEGLSDGILTQIGNEGDSPNTVPSVVTTTQLGQILPEITGIVAANQAAYQAYIDANPSLFSAPATAAEVQAMVTTVNTAQIAIAASNAVLTQIGNEADEPGDLPPVPSVVTTTQLGQILPTITGIIAANQSAYQAYIDANPNLFSAPATAAEVQAMINTVNLTQTTVFYVDVTKTDNTGDGLSWATAKKDLQVILDTYANNPGPNVNEVWLKAGNYSPTSFVGTSTAARDKSFWVKGNIKIYGGFNGTETELSQRNIVNNPTLLNGAGAYHTMIVTNTNATSYTLIDGVTIMGGNANGSSTNTVGSNNFERNFGGGVLCYQNAPIFNNVIFKTNAAEYGGGVFNQAASPKYNNCVFTENTSTSYGGAIENFDNSSPAFNNCVISNNSAFRGGGAANNGGTPTYINCTIVKNIATVATAGGAFHNLNATTSTYKNCIIWGNTVSDFLTEAGSTTNVSYSVTQSTIAGTLNLSTDPQLVNSNDGNGADDKWFTNDDGFKIALISNCGSTGDNTAIASYITGDIQNNARILQDTVDRGAYEIDGANASNSALAQIGNEGDAPNAVLSTVTTTQLGQIVPIITGIVTANEAAYQVYIDANPSLFSAPATAAEVQAMVTAVNAALSVRAFDKNSIVLYPNPSNGVFNIEIETNATFELYNMIGKRLLSDKITTGTTALNLSDYSDGVYLLLITNENNQTKTIRLMKNSK